MKEKSQYEAPKTPRDKEKKVTPPSVDMAEAHALIRPLLACITI